MFYKLHDETKGKMRSFTELQALYKLPDINIVQYLQT